MAVVEFAVGGLEGVVVEEVAVVYGDDVGRAGGGEVDAGVLSGMTVLLASTRVAVM